MVFVVFAARSKLLKMQAGWYQWTRRAGAVWSFRALCGNQIRTPHAIDATSLQPNSLFDFHTGRAPRRDLTHSQFTVVERPLAP